jgi:hypothetical protein
MAAYLIYRIDADGHIRSAPVPLECETDQEAIAQTQEHAKRAPRAAGRPADQAPSAAVTYLSLKCQAQGEAGSVKGIRL